MKVSRSTRRDCSRRVRALPGEAADVVAKSRSRSFPARGSARENSPSPFLHTLPSAHGQESVLTTQFVLHRRRPCQWSVTPLRALRGAGAAPERRYFPHGRTDGRCSLWNLKAEYESQDGSGEVGVGTLALALLQSGADASGRHRFLGAFEPRVTNRAHTTRRARVTARLSPLRAHPLRSSTCPSLPCMQ